jgi:hypothetical protein
MDHQTFAQLLGNYGEFVGAIAVVATLLFLTLQIRQNTRSASITRASLAQQQLTSLHDRIMSNKELADLVARCRSSDLGDLSPGDQERLHRVANYYINSYLNVENAYLRGEFQQREYDTYCQDFRRTLVNYPALKPEMINIMDHFKDTDFPIVGPLFE